MKVVRSSPLGTGRLYPHRSMALIFRGWVDPRAYVSVGSYGKKPQRHHWGSIPTSRLVAQCLNHYATPGPSKSELLCRYSWNRSKSQKNNSAKSFRPRSERGMSRIQILSISVWASLLGNWVQCENSEMRSKKQYTHQKISLVGRRVYREENNKIW
jgi:hypothetical protein